MTAVTQKIPAYLGGVSRQPDVKKLPGQVREAINAYPDPTFGLIKRPGTKLTKELGDSSPYANGYWFSIFRDKAEGYIGCIKGNEIHIWNVNTGVKATVTYEGQAQSYLTGTRTDYHVLTVQDLSLITNKAVVVRALGNSTNPTVTKAAILVKEAAYRTEYNITINGITKSWVTRNTDDAVGPADPPKKEINVEEILTQLKSEIESMGQGITVVQLPTSLELSSPTAFTVSSKSGADAKAVEVFVDRVDAINGLPKESVNGRVVLVSNSAKDEDDYYVKFIADNGTSGPGVWEETVKPGISPGLNPNTMPHELKNTGVNQFVFRSLTEDKARPEQFFWEPRLVGDEDSNSHPSFVDNTIQQSFFYNNRLGFLTGDNVSMSQSGEYFNFYHISALTQTAADPIDISCSSVRPAVLHGVLPSAQGLVLFSNDQQFIMTGGGGPITPSTAIIKVISSYEMDDFVDPIDMGTTFVFLSKTPSFTRVFELITRGQEENPIVTDIGRIVGDWLPEAIDQLIASPQNNFFSLASQTSPVLYMLRSYREGEQVLVSGWVKWKLPGTIQYHVVDRDVVYMMLNVDGKLVLTAANLNQATRDEVLLAPGGDRVDPRLDLWQYARDVSYDKITKMCRLYIDHTHYKGLTPIILTVERDTLTTEIKVIAGSFFDPTSQGSDAKGSYYELRDVDLTKYSKVAVGYIYRYQVDLPTVYFTKNDGKDTDYSATLTIGRYKFAVGLNGLMSFQVKSLGRSDWEDRHPVIDTNYYLAGGSAMVDQKIFTVPIHQQATHHSVRVISDSPYPTSLISMAWEGNYSPRFYRRG